ncbi:MAG: hydrogenase [Verrucomicrobiales bacterium]|nr:hydrogenase [Verrucomicrobiales bacterium]
MAHDSVPTSVKIAPPPQEMERPALVENNRSIGWISDTVAGVIENKTPTWWKFTIALSLLVSLGLPIGLVYLISTGVGVWGLNHPVAWGWAIVNFVWWIGIGHAGTLISAILFLLRQKWRTSINRASEAMPIFAVMCAGIFPAVHVGRIWFDWWLFPLPNANSIWPQFRSPLLWDVFAVSTYFTVSVLFWYMGLIPDLATMRDRFRKVAGKVIEPAAKLRNKLAQFLYGLFSLGWTGSNRHWRNYEKAYLLLAGLSTPLVLSVHSIVSFDFAVSQLPGWHTTIFPPYFVAGAVFGGFAMVMTLMIPLVSLYKGLDEIVTIRHLEVMSKVILVTGSIVGYAYGMEFFIAYYGGNPYELYAFKNRAFGDMNWSYWWMIGCNVLAPQFFWFKWCRTTPWFIWVVCGFVNIGMWMERFVIVVTSLHNDFMPGNWGYYSPSWVDMITYFGTFGFFMTLFLLFCRFLPLIAISEVKGVTPQADPHHPKGGAKH